MLLLDKNNLVEYLRAKYPQWIPKGNLRVSRIGESEEDAAGLINYLFRVMGEDRSLIVKQGREDILASAGRADFHYQLPTTRNWMEYLSLRLRGAIAPDFVPKVFAADRENNIFLMEDVSYLQLCRKELTQGKVYPQLGRQCAQFIAASNFYISEFYLETDTFRKLGCYFTNTEMRRVMEQWVFLRKPPFADGPRAGDLRRVLEDSPEIMAATYEMLHKFMSTPESLVHADIHTSNIFLDQERLKVIDMEYTFAGPCCYDVSYLLASLISQYAAAQMRTYGAPDGGESYRRYLLGTIGALLDGFIEAFSALWDQDAKEVYQACPAYKEKLLAGFLPDIAGYAAMPILCICLTGMSTVMEFAAISGEEKREKAVRLYFLMGCRLLLERERMRTTEDILRLLAETAVEGLER